MDRSEKSSGFKGKVVVASKGVKPRTITEDEDGKAEEITDPHAWQASPTASSTSPISATG